LVGKNESNLRRELAFQVEELVHQAGELVQQTKEDFVEKTKGNTVSKFKQIFRLERKPSPLEKPLPPPPSSNPFRTSAGQISLDVIKPQLIYYLHWSSQGWSWNTQLEGKFVEDVPSGQEWCQHLSEQSVFYPQALPRFLNQCHEEFKHNGTIPKWGELEAWILACHRHTPTTLKLHAILRFIFVYMIHESKVY
jgi:hypothetical protein